MVAISPQIGFETDSM